MRSRIAAFAALVTGFASSLLTAADRPAIRQLENAEIFAFGGVGFASVISQEETAYRALMTHSSVQSDLETLFSKGNAQAKAYALTGLWQINPKRFAELASSLETSSKPVRTMRGCLMMNVPMHNVIQSIRAGQYSIPGDRDSTPHR